MVSGLKKLERDFYKRNTLVISKELLGKYLVHNSKNGKTVGKIVETEAYIGPYDRASHAFKNRFTRRTSIQFGPGGYAYIYQIYGCHFCFNVVTQKKNMPEVVLVRALEPVYGNEIMARRRNMLPLQNRNIQLLTNGPGKLCKAMAIDKSLYGIDLCGDTLYVCNGEQISEHKIASSTRINIDYAQSSRDYPWRFFIKGNKFVSK
jgi:DNA-3-methyladenine glycosylase